MQSPSVKVPLTIIKQILDFKLGENVNSVDHVLPCLNVLFNSTDLHLRLHVTRHHSPQKAFTNPLTSSLSFQPLYRQIRIIPPDFDIRLGQLPLLMRPSKISDFWMVKSRRQLDAWTTYFTSIIYFHISTYSYSSRTFINTPVQGTLNIAYNPLLTLHKSNFHFLLYCKPT